MFELLIVGGILFVAYTLAQGQRAKLAGQFQPNVLIQNTGGRGTVVTGEPNSASPLALTAQSNLVPSGAVIGPPVPPILPYGIKPLYLGPPITAVPAISGSTSFSTAADPATGPVQNYIPFGTGPDGGIQRIVTI